MAKTNYYACGSYLSCAYRTTPSYPSADPMRSKFNPHAESKYVPETYTGTEIQGIATGHKSNLYPVSRSERTVMTNPKIQ
jgi:hypothetical protein